MQYDDLPYWQSGEWQAVEEKLHDIRRKGTTISPAKENLFAALDACPFERTKAVIVGQDPYPDPSLATGIAFSIPRNAKTFPPTLVNILREYHDDLGYPVPTHGDLTKWTESGVLLWNAIPSCEAWKSLSHNWVEWQLLTQQLLAELSKKGIVFTFLGGVARDFVKYVDQDESYVIETSHPSPRGSLNSKTPFVGSRIFSRINADLCSLGLEAIDWRL